MPCLMDATSSGEAGWSESSLLLLLHLHKIATTLAPVLAKQLITLRTSYQSFTINLLNQFSSVSRIARKRDS
jgi:hypothetical protein